MRDRLVSILGAIACTIAVGVLVAGVSLMVVDTMAYHPHPDQVEGP